MKTIIAPFPGYTKRGERARHPIYGDICKTLRRMKPQSDMCIEADVNAPTLYMYAKMAGVRVVTRKVNGAVRIWRG